jgi:hypothetical protein
METENTYTIHSHIHQYAPGITVGLRRSLLFFHERDSEVIFTAGEGRAPLTVCHGG